MGDKFCGCMDFRVLAWIALGFQIAAIVLMFGPEPGRILLIGAGYPIVGGHIAKIVLLAVSLLCCKNDTCPRISAAVMFFIFVGIEIIWLIIIWIMANLIGAVAGMAEGNDDDDISEIEEYLIWFNIICLIYVVFIALEITFGVGLC